MSRPATVFARRRLSQILSRTSIAVLVGPGAKADPLQDGSFQAYVLALLQAKHPEWRAAPGSDKQTVMVEGGAAFLGNLYNEVDGLPEPQQDQAIISWFETLKSSFDQSDGQDASSYTAISQALRPQIVPGEYLQEVPTLISRPFLANLLVSYAIDSPKEYALIERPSFDRWHVAQRDMEKQAIRNLESASLSLVFQPIQGAVSGACVAVSANDGYDAARLLLPQFMQRLGNMLNATALFSGIPCRDLLVAWTPDYDKRRVIPGFIDQMLASQGHPLTDALFVVAGGRVRLANAEELADNGR